MTNYNVRIVSDTICPWCYVGYRRLQTAIRQHQEKYPDDTFTSTWHAYQLNPNAPTVGIDKREYYEKRFGPGAIEKMYARLGAAGDEAGIKFSFGGKTGNTRASHRLIAYALEKEEQDPEKNVGLQNRLVEALQTAFFEQEKDITSHEVLRAAAVQAGISDEEANRVLESDECGPLVDRELEEARLAGIHGVPNFTVNDTFQIEGAQEPKAFEMLFKRLKERSKA